MPCPSCGSNLIRQKKHTTGGGWALVVIGLGLAPFTLGVSLLLCFAALFMTVHKGHCRECRWAWRC